jgi:hypothetical protein
MPDAALYFPYIEVPDRPSLTRVLLYWDRLGTIVPASVGHDIWPRTRKLVQCDLVEPVDPAEYLRELDGFAEAFLEVAEAATAVGAGAGPKVPIHKEKSTPRLWKALERRGVVESGSEPGWMMVDERVAGIFMAYLAMCLGRCCALEPITDKRASFAGVAVPAGLRFSAGLDVMRAAMLANVLPAPSTPVPPETIADFKHAYWDELRAFRLRVERALLDCIRPSGGAPSQERTTGRDESEASATDDERREWQRRCLEQAAVELEAEVAQLEAAMRRRTGPTARGLLGAAMAGAVPGAKFAATGDPFEGASAVSPIVVEVAGTLLGRARNDDLTSPVAYAALAREEFGN